MMQTWAIFYEAYRALNAKKMFWIVLGISGLVVAALGCLGINEHGLKIAFWQIDSVGLNSQTVPPPLFYKWLFLNLGVGFWLTWIATILALISTAGIFPDLITSGAVDLVISKPIGRLRLFLTQYAAALLFVTLQVTIFSVASFLVMGLRGGVWIPGLFIGIPLVVCFFSYLYAVCVLVGMLTRSTVAALLLTLLFWAFVSGVGKAENVLLAFRTMAEQGIDFSAPPPERAPRRTTPQPDPFAVEESAGPDEALPGPDPNEPDLLYASEPEPVPQMLIVIHNILYGMKTCLPKTGDTLNLMDRTMVSMAELSEAADRQRQGRPSDDIGFQIEEEYRSRSVAWIVGTSLAFEALVLAWAAWLFCRRDY